MRIKNLLYETSIWNKSGFNAIIKTCISKYLTEGYI